MKQFTAPTCRALAQEIEAALQAVARKHNVGIHYSGGKFDQTNFNLKLSIKITDQQVVGEKERDDFNLYCSAYGCKPEHYKARFSLNGTDYELRGFNLNRPKFAIKAWNITEGKTVFFVENVLRRVAGTQKHALLTKSSFN